MAALWLVGQVGVGEQRVAGALRGVLGDGVESAADVGGEKGVPRAKRLRLRRRLRCLCAASRSTLLRVLFYTYTIEQTGRGK